MDPRSTGHTSTANGSFDSSTTPSLPFTDPLVWQDFDFEQQLAGGGIGSSQQATLVDYLNNFKTFPHHEGFHQLDAGLGPSVSEIPISPSTATATDTDNTIAEILSPVDENVYPLSLDISDWPQPINQPYQWNQLPHGDALAQVEQQAAAEAPQDLDDLDLGLKSFAPVREEDLFDPSWYVGAEPLRWQRPPSGEVLWDQNLPPLTTNEGIEDVPRQWDQPPPSVASSNPSTNASPSSFGPRSAPASSFTRPLQGSPILPNSAYRYSPLGYTTHHSRLRGSPITGLGMVPRHSMTLGTASAITSTAHLPYSPGALTAPARPSDPSQRFFFPDVPTSGHRSSSALPSPIHNFPPGWSPWVKGVSALSGSPAHSARGPVLDNTSYLPDSPMPEGSAPTYPLGSGSPYPASGPSSHPNTPASARPLDSPLGSTGTGVQRSTRRASPLVPRGRRISTVSLSAANSPRRQVLPPLQANNITQFNLRKVLQERIDLLETGDWCNSKEDQILLDRILTHDQKLIEDFGRQPRCAPNTNPNKNQKRAKESRSTKKNSSPNQPGRFVCFSCATDITSRQNLFKHMRSHLGIKNAYCERCDKHFSGDLARHQRTCSR